MSLQLEEGGEVMETKSGVPFLRLDLGEKRVALPYSRLERIQFRGNQSALEICFDSTSIQIEGKKLKPLWMALSLGEVASLTVGQDQQSGMQVRKIEESFRSED